MGVLQTLSATPGSLDLSFSAWTILTISLLLLFSLPILFILGDYIRVLYIRQRLPPGPFPLPLVGNFFQIPKVKPWVEFEKWSQYYDNPMFTIWQGHRPTIMCNDIWTISDMLDKRANIYSSRPRM